MATIENFSGGEILGAGIWQSFVELNTTTGQSTARVIINGATVIPAGTPIELAQNTLRELINNSSTSPELKKLYARALQSLSRQQAELLSRSPSNEINQVREPLPGVNASQNAIANGTGGATESVTSSNQEQDDQRQIGAPSTSGLATGTTSPTIGVGTGGPLGESQSISAIGSETAAARDAGFGTSKAGVNETTENLNKPNSGKPNPLSELSSYTYSLVLYMVTPEKMNEFILNGGSLLSAKESGSGVYVIAKSGGINNSADKRLITLSGNLGLEQEGYDYYIDDLALTTFLPGGPNRQTVSTEMKFKIYEPHSFSFLTDVAKASRGVNSTSDIAKKSPVDLNGFQQHYILGIKFYGYDANGNIATSKSPSSSGNIDEQNVYIQRFFAIKFTNIKFKLDGKMTVYNCEAVIVSEQEAYNRTNGGARAQLNLVGGTVGEVLAGGGVNSRGLAQVLTNMNETAKNNNQIDIPTEIKIEFLDADGNPVSASESEIGRSPLLDDGAFAAATAPLSQAQSTNKVTVANTFKATTIDTTKSTVGVTAGTPITSIIDNVIVKSRWITDALTKTSTDDPEGKTKDITARRDLRWYTINPIVTVSGLDSKTKNWAYNITYQIKPYTIPYIKTTLANKSKYPGPYKFYNYLFTGENTEILSYEQQFDNLYFIIASESSNPSERDGSTGRSPVAISNTPGNSDPRGGKNNNGSKLNDEVRAQLYSPGDQAQAKIKILGDPDYIMTTTGVKLNSASAFYGNDNSISPLGGQVFIQIVFKMAVDYNTKDGKSIENGLMDITDKIQFYQTDRVRKADIQGVVYMITQVDSVFNRGQFTQTLECLMVDESVLLTPENKASSAGQRENTSDTTAQTSSTITSSPAQSTSTAQSASAPTTVTPAVSQEVRTTNIPTNTRSNVPSSKQVSRGSTSEKRNSSLPQNTPTNTPGITGVGNDDAVIELPELSPTQVGA